MTRDDLIEKVVAFVPYNEQEAADRQEMIHFLLNEPTSFSRDNTRAHMTVSAWVVNRDRSRVLMAYHKIYDSWAWLGGHADGCEDLPRVAIKEAMEESGLTEVSLVSEDILSLEILPVAGHVKKGAYVSSHLHMNVTFLLEADDEAPLRVCEDENEAVDWIPNELIPEKSTEAWVTERIYRKLMARVATLSSGCVHLNKWKEHHAGLQ
ncbi:MAG: NUDIX hydrolase [Lachnospiraceae bacterium]|nr:NUDIX hydrolase [Lachnospiraceae bacterium]